MSPLRDSKANAAPAWAGAFLHLELARVERIVALARRNGNQKREFGRSGAWFRDQMLRLVLPINARSQDWIYGYDPRAVMSPAQTTNRRDRQAA